MALMHCYNFSTSEYCFASKMSNKSHIFGIFCHCTKHFNSNIHYYKKKQHRKYTRCVMLCILVLMVYLEKDKQLLPIVIPFVPRFQILHSQFLICNLVTCMLCFSFFLWRLSCLVEREVICQFSSCCVDLFVMQVLNLSCIVVLL